MKIKQIYDRTILKMGILSIFFIKFMGFDETIGDGISPDTLS